MAKPRQTNPSRQPAQSPKPSPQQQNQQGQVFSAQWSGPLPHPGALDQFNNIIPNGADRIMKMVEQEQAHRIAHDSQALEAEIEDTRRGQWMGVTISIIALIGCVLSVYLGAHPTVSIALVGLPIVALIKAFLKRS